MMLRVEEAAPAVVWSDHAAWRYQSRARSKNMDAPTAEIAEAIETGSISRRHGGFFYVDGAQTRLTYVCAWRLGGRTAVVVTVLRRYMRAA